LLTEDENEECEEETYTREEEEEIKRRLNSLG
jgi:hypothetical protein